MWTPKTGYRSPEELPIPNSMVDYLEGENLLFGNTGDDSVREGLERSKEVQKRVDKLTKTQQLHFHSATALRQELDRLAHQREDIFDPNRLHRRLLARRSATSELGYTDETLAMLFPVWYNCAVHRNVNNQPRSLDVEQESRRLVAEIRSQFEALTAALQELRAPVISPALAKEARSVMADIAATQRVLTQRSCPAAHLVEATADREQFASLFVVRRLEDLYDILTCAMKDLKKPLAQVRFRVKHTRKARPYDVSLPDWLDLLPKRANQEALEMFRPNDQVQTDMGQVGQVQELTDDGRLRVSFPSDPNVPEQTFTQDALTQGKVRRASVIKGWFEDEE
jgi:hypothetical protein